MYVRMKRYLTLLKMAEDIIISGLPCDATQLDAKRQKPLECILTGKNSKLYLEKVYTEHQIKKLSNGEVDKLFSNYEAKLSGQMAKFLGKSIINICSMGACATLGISNEDGLSEDLKSDPFLNSALKRFTCELYYRFGSFLDPVSVRLIVSRQYLSEKNKKMENKNEQVTIKMEEMTEKPSKCKTIGAVISIGVLGFWFGIGAALGIKMVNSLEEIISR